MFIWVLIILVLGSILAFAPQWIDTYSLSQRFGTLIMLISLGLGVRIMALGRKREKEKFARKVEILEEKITKIENESGKPKNKTEQSEENKPA